MNDPYEVAPDIYVLPSYATVPGVGVLPNNVFLLLGEEPVRCKRGRVDPAPFRPPNYCLPTRGISA
jgi:hypothetical protein